jgi:hypothetical protein
MKSDIPKIVKIESSPGRVESPEGNTVKNIRIIAYRPTFFTTPERRADMGEGAAW